MKDYTNGASVKNSASGVCSSSYGSLDWAKQQCDKYINCKWLHDWGCDGKNWRFCSNVELDDYKGSGGCSQIKPENTGKFKRLYL